LVDVLEIGPVVIGLDLADIPIKVCAINAEGFKDAPHVCEEWDVVCALQDEIHRQLGRQRIEFICRPGSANQSGYATAADKRC